MRLNRLNIFGFKSFADETEILFPSGLIAIVGPNGCGKSNIGDAIRWVLGEQSARILRGKEMGDVIFNGTSYRKSLGMTEVTIELSNPGSLPIGYQNIEITRRLYRSGESEYLLNKRPCRLKDITDLFLECGINKRAYSILEQGNIDFILSAKPQERRILIETAAGVLKYKERKRETEQKIEQTRANLARIQDVKNEVEAQRDLLDKQAKRTRAYKRLCQRSDEREKALLTLRYKLLIFNHRESLLLCEQLCDQEKALIAELEKTESRMEKVRLDGLQLETDFDKRQKALWQIEGERGQMEKRADTLTQEIGFRKEHLTRLERDFAGLSEKKKRSGTMIIEFDEGIINIERELTILLDKQKGIEEERDALHVRERETSEEIIKKRKIHNEINRDISAHHKTISDLQARLENLKQRLAENHLEGKEITNTESGTREAIVRVERNIESQASQIKFSYDTKRRLDEERGAISEALNEKSLQIDKQRDKWNGIRHRLNHLEELEKGLDGFDEAVKYLVKHPYVDLKYTLSQILEVEEVYECALESILGNYLQAILVRDSESAIELINDLKANEKGKASFIPRAIKPQHESIDIPREIASHPGFIGKLLDFVNASASNHDAIQPFLDKTLIVDSIKSGIEIRERFLGLKAVGQGGMDKKRCTQKTEWEFVTIQGDLITSSGIISGGSPGKRNSDSILGRKRQINRLKISLNQEKETLERLLREKEDITKSLDKQDSDIEKIRTEIAHMETSKKEQDHELKYLNAELATLDRKRQRIASNQKQWESDLTNIEKGLLCAKQEEKKLLNDLTVIEEATAGLQKAGKTIQEKMKVVDKAYMDQGIAIASLKERLHSLRKERKRTEESKKGTEKQAQKTGSEITSVRQMIRDAEREHTDIERRLPEIRTRSIEEHKGLEEIRISLNQVKQETLEYEERLKSIRLQLEQKRKQINVQQVNATEWHTRIDDLVSAFHIDYPDEIPNKSEIPSLQKEMESLKEDLEKMKVRIQNFGPVNLNAIEEFQRVDERYQFLNGQINDLLNALNTLNDIIKEINTTSRTLFQETFSIVNKNFNTLFVRLFEGGFAELRLEEGIDCLDAGINIIAQPPGKTLQNIELLSGGERALTALALIFAVYQQRPSPFCILDEVDAPLDESNIDRFLKLVKEVKGNTQFLIITHNKKTMQEVDALYGVTMESPGISKLVTVKLEEPAELCLSPLPQKRRYEELVH